MAAELKTDAWHRYMLYRSSERYMTLEPEEKRKEAVEAGKKFTASAYADVWAKDPDLVKRVRAFLGENFHWHDRLVKDGTDLHVVQTLMDMVRGGSVAVIPEKPILGGGIAWPPTECLFQLPILPRLLMKTQYLITRYDPDTRQVEQFWLSEDAINANRLRPFLSVPGWPRRAAR